jgi:hypothetical protein
MRENPLGEKAGQVHLELQAAGDLDDAAED